MKSAARCFSLPIINVAVLVLSLPAGSTAQPETGQIRYVRSGAAGAGTGVDWTDASPSLPRVLLRGATYYVATGTYGTYAFDTPVAGSALVTIKKATVSDHGTDLGWRDSYGTGPAAWDAVTFASSYWVFDGSTGGGPGSWTSGHGFTFTVPAGATKNFVTLGDTVSNITLRHVAFTQTGDTIVAARVNAIYNATVANDLLFEYLYIHNISGLPFFLRGGRNVIIQYSYTGTICGMYIADVGFHCEALVEWSLSDVHFRWNYIAQSPSSGGFVKNASATSDSVRIYGNVFRDGFPVNCNTGTCTNWRIFNNTFASGIRGGPVGGSGTYSGLLYYNNITYDGRSVGPLLGTHGYNWYSTISTNSCSMASNSSENICAGCNAGCDDITATQNPFVAVTGQHPEDLQLAFALAGWSGTPICALDPCTGEKKYHLDMFGRNRGTTGEWTRGAFQSLQSTPASPPAAPTAVRIVR